MFDTSQPIDVKIFSAGEVFEKLRWPTDQELIERSKKLRLIRRNLGRGRGQWEPLNDEPVNAELFSKLRVEENGDRTYDSAEAAKFVSRLLEQDVVTAERVGDKFEVAMLVTWQKHKVKHVLRMPTQRQILDYKKANNKSYEIKTGLEIRIQVEPAATLWDALYASTEGYANGHVPITHKQAAIVEVIDIIDKLEEGDDPEA